MVLKVRYEKKAVLQALRYHFISRREMKVMMILVNVFALFAAVLYGYKLISPLPFIMSSMLWICMMFAFWIWLPLAIYKKSKTFRNEFEISIEPQHFFILTESGRKGWAWREFSNFYETPAFFHLYFDSKTFFLLPKDTFENEEGVAEARKIIKEGIKGKS